MQDKSSDDRRLIPVKGHPGICRREPGTGYVVIFRRHGKQHKRYFRTLSEARAFKGRAASGAALPSSRTPFNTYALAWCNTYTGRTSKGLSDRTRASYKDAVERVLIPHFGTARLDRITPSDIRKFIAHLVEQRYAPATARRYFAPLRAMLQCAVEEDLIARNPADGVRVIVPGERQRKPKRLSVEQTRALLAQMPAEHADLAYLLAATGLRISEALALTWADFQGGAEGHPVLVITRSKTEAGERRVPLSPNTVRLLLKRRGDESDDAPIFPSSAGTAIDPHNYRREVFRPAAQRAGVPWATPHVLRHGVASLMAEQGYSPAQIAGHLGHADGGVLALKTYIHADIIESPDFLDDAFGG